MKHATSMYLGGITILATEANYETSRELGCRCVSCGEAVFLRAGAVRDTTLRNGKKATQIVDPAFAHYKGNGRDDCEKRSHSKQAEDRVKAIIIAGKNQRLKLYNRRLWEMMKRDRNMKKTVGLSLKKKLGQSFIDLVAKTCRKEFFKLGSDIYPYIEDSFSLIGDASFLSLEQAKSRFLSEEDLKYQQDFFKYDCDSRLHLAVCHEIAEFLQTRTSGYFWRNYVPQLLVGYLIQMQSRIKSDRSKSALQNFIQKTLLDEPDFLLKLAFAGIVSTHWLVEIEQTLKSDRTILNS